MKRNELSLITLQGARFRGTVMGRVESSTTILLIRGDLMMVVFDTRCPEITMASDNNHLKQCVKVLTGFCRGFEDVIIPKGMHSGS